MGPLRDQLYEDSSFTKLLLPSFIINSSIQTPEFRDDEVKNKDTLTVLKHIQPYCGMELS